MVASTTDMLGVIAKEHVADSVALMFGHTLQARVSETYRAREFIFRA
jgi:hypothetical protein